MAYRKDQHQANTILLGSILKRLRQKRHMTETDVATSLTISLSTYSGWERGRCRPAFEDVMRFAVATDTDGIAIMCALFMHEPDFATRCADNMFATKVLAGLDSINTRLADVVSQMDGKAIELSIENICNSVVAFKSHQQKTATEWFSDIRFGRRDVS